MTRWPLLFFTLAAGAAQAPKYTGPVPPQSDVLYLRHAANLLATEAAEVKAVTDKDDTRYTIAGETSPAKTPLPLPVFMVKAQALDPMKLQLVRLRKAEGHREITASEIRKSDPIHVSVTRFDGDLYRLDVSDSLEDGEYMLLTPGAGRGFCFAVE